MAEAKRRLTQYKQFLEVCASSDKQASKIALMKELIDDSYAKDPFIQKSEHVQGVCDRAVNEFGMSPTEAKKIYETTANRVMPFMNSGDKIAQADAQLDALSRIAKDNLFQAVFDKDGNELEKQFNPKVMDSIVRALKVKADHIGRIQANIVNAMKVVGEQAERQKDLNLEIDDRQQLENYLNQELMNAPELAVQLMKKKEERKSLATSQFYEETDIDSIPLEIEAQVTEE